MRIRPSLKWVRPAETAFSRLFAPLSSSQSSQIRTYYRTNENFGRRPDIYDNDFFTPQDDKDPVSSRGNARGNVAILSNSGEALRGTPVPESATNMHDKPRVSSGTALGGTITPSTKIYQDTSPKFDLKTSCRNRVNRRAAEILTRNYLASLKVDQDSKTKSLHQLHNFKHMFRIINFQNVKNSQRSNPGPCASPLLRKCPSLRQRLQRRLPS